MVDTDTEIGRFLAQLKFCAVMIDDGHRSFLATRCSSVCGRYGVDSEGVDGRLIEVGVVGADGKVSEFLTVDYGELASHRIVKVDGSFYLDTVGLD